jgi:Zn-dependent peptidase ImmA (M78 family)
LDIPALAKCIQKKHGTTDPRRIVKAKGILLLSEYLGKSTWGYYSNVNRIPIIHTHEGLEEPKVIFTVSHELGHHELHPKTNTPYLKANTFFSVDKIEQQANRFAVELLIPDELLLEGYTIYQAAEMCNVPPEIAHLKSIPVFTRHIY